MPLLTLSVFGLKKSEYHSVDQTSPVHLNRFKSASTGDATCIDRVFNQDQAIACPLQLPRLPDLLC